MQEKVYKVSYSIMFPTAGQREIRSVYTDCDFKNLDDVIKQDYNAVIQKYMYTSAQGFVINFIECDERSNIYKEQK